MMYEQVGATSQTARLEDYLKAIRAHRLLIVLTVLVMLLVGSWFNGRRVPGYEAETAVALGPTPVGSTNPNSLLAPSVERESEILASSKTAVPVIAKLGLDETPAAVLQGIEVLFVPNSAVLELTASGTDPEEVSAIANAFVEEYTSTREAEAVAFYEADIAVYQGQVDDVEAELDAKNAEIAALTAERQRISGGTPTATDVARIGEIDGQLATLRTEVGILTNRNIEANRNLNNSQRSQSSRQTTAEVIRLSEPPDSPTGIGNNVLLAGFGLVGLALGIAAAFIAERLDTTARDEKALSLALGATVVGQIPSFGVLNRSGTAGLVMLNEGTSARIHRTQESIRRLRSAVQFLLPTAGKDGTLVFAVSSAYPGEGKSTTSANLAIALAQGGQRVILVSADLRRPTIEALFDITATTGLSELLGRQEDSISLVESGVDNLWIVPSGSSAKNPSELLGSTVFATAIEELRSGVDFVIIDTPPVLSAADALVVGARADGMLVVVDSRTTDTEDLLQLRSELERSGTRLLGGVLNRDRRRRGSLFRRDRYDYRRTSGSR